MNEDALLSNYPFGYNVEKNKYCKFLINLQNFEKFTFLNEIKAYENKKIF